jgi:glycosyltransferase involved in cell wall biosynthesis
VKVLWFTNTPCSAVEQLGMNLNSGGWLKSLEEELHKLPEVELSICFYSYQHYEPFTYNGTQFYPVLRKGKKDKIRRWIKRIFNNGTNDKHEIKELLEVIQLINPDIIHVHGTEDNFGLVQYQTNIPMVISLQGLLNPYVEKYYAGIPHYISSRHEGIIPKLLVSSINQTFELFLKDADREKRILKNARFIIGRTDWDRRISSIMAPRCKYYIGNEILRTAFYESSWSKKQFDNTIKIVTISSNALYKGFETIVSTAQVLKQNTNFSFFWTVIGLDENSSVVKLVKKWKDIQFSDINIQLRGSINENEVVEILLKSDIYCQTSHIENSPNSLCEAMILGMPIIATNAGGTSSLIKDKEDGILIQDGDSYSIAGAILELSFDFLRSNKYGESARNKAGHRHSRDSIRTTIIEIYKDIIDSVKI